MRIEAKHYLELSCDHCPDKAQIDLTHSYGSHVPDLIKEFKERHDDGCKRREDARKAAA
jgi:hypothetical protein